ncbi:N(4)-(beta-N-acetylglucosaminyl)-L-asparaginase [Cryomorphaceae bacterium 1068]|nr:N(4)-(beta-N-acetylglucosaminyl)-L-asparaginase [Cryomorphaceae bacterium 1068]
MDRRKFIRSTGQVGLGLAVVSCGVSPESEQKAAPAKVNSGGPISICTWGFVDANQTSGNALEKGKSALDAAIEGVSVEEADIKNTTVGRGGAPDREGRVTLDACVMAPDGNAGSVVCVQNITHVASLARKVMTDTPHVMLAGKGAEEFGYQNGFPKEDLLTEESEAKYKEWLKEKDYKPIINIENHDTIGMLTLDKNGDIAGACTTSGLGYKMAGRVGDSPIIGSGLFVDNEVGGASGTGLGEEIMKQVGSFLIVELMRNGMSPAEACKEAVMRTVKKSKDIKDFQIGYIAINKAGETGSYSLHEGFARMEFRGGKNNRIASEFYLG